MSAVYPPPPEQGGPYGSQPPPGYYQPPPVERGPRPPATEWATRLMGVVAVLSAAGIVVSLLTIDQLRARFRALNRQDGNEQLDHLVNTALTIGVVTGIVILVLYCLLIVQVRKGRNWARVVTWVVAGLGVLGLLGELASTQTTAARILGGAEGLIDIVVIVLLALAPSNDWFAGRRRG